jgi:hypothetical protein
MTEQEIHAQWRRHLVKWGVQEIRRRGWREYLAKFAVAELRKQGKHMTPRAKSAPPRKLAADGLALWKRVLADYNVDDTGARELLCLACESLDRACSLRAAIDKEGEFIQTRTGGLREHPGLKLELAARSFCAKMLCRLGLHVEPLRSTSGRPGYGGLGITRGDV